MRLTERRVCYPRCDKQGNLDKVEYIHIEDKKLAEEKLCQLEDIMEKHDINSAEELEHIILNNATGEQTFNDFVIYTVKPFLTKRVNFQTLIPIIEKGWTWEDYMNEENDKNTGEHQFADERLTETEFNSIREFLLKLGH